MAEKMGSPGFTCIAEDSGSQLRLQLSLVINYLGHTSEPYSICLSWFLSDILIQPDLGKLLKDTNFHSIDCMLLNVVVSRTDFTRCSSDEMSREKKKGKKRNKSGVSLEWILKCTFHFHSFQYGRTDSGACEAGFFSVCASKLLCILGGSF